MTALMTVLVAGSGLAAAATTSPADRPALVVDASVGRHGRDLIDPALKASGATIRLPRTPAEARTDVRYLEASGHRVQARGPMSTAALDALRRAGR